MKEQVKKIETAFISVYKKEKIDNLVKYLSSKNVQIISTGGTEKYIQNLGIDVQPVESLTNFPSILEGRVKTLHPKVFGGILNKRKDLNDIQEVKKFDIPNIDMVIVDLYPFEETVKDRKSKEQDIIEKIDIGGVSLIRAAAKNFKDVFVVPCISLFSEATRILKNNNGKTTESIRKIFAKKSFNLCSKYDSNIYHWFNNETQGQTSNLNLNFSKSNSLLLA